MRILYVWGHIQREWGFEVRADYKDDAGRVQNEVLVFTTEPDVETLMGAVQDRLAVVSEQASQDTQELGGVI